MCIMAYLKEHATSQIYSKPRITNANLFIKNSHSTLLLSQKGAASRLNNSLKIYFNPKKIMQTTLILQEKSKCLFTEVGLCKMYKNICEYINSF